MEERTYKRKRTLRDVSHHFLSALENQKRGEENVLKKSTVVTAVPEEIPQVVCQEKKQIPVFHLVGIDQSTIIHEALICAEALSAHVDCVYVLLVDIATEDEAVVERAKVRVKQVASHEMNAFFEMNEGKEPGIYGERHEHMAVLMVTQFPQQIDIPVRGSAVYPIVSFSLCAHSLPIVYAVIRQLSVFYGIASMGCIAYDTVGFGVERSHRYITQELKNLVERFLKTSLEIWGVCNREKEGSVVFERFNEYQPCSEYAEKWYEYIGSLYHSPEVCVG